MEQIELQTSTRQLMGKKARFLRRQGITPVHLFGHDTESMALQCETALLKQVLKEAGKTRLVGLKVDDGQRPHSVVVREVQRNALSGDLVHVDFFKVSLKEKIKVDVPIVLVGEAPALEVKTNALTQELDTLEIECLPDRIPDQIEVDISVLVEADQVIQVRDLVLAQDVTPLTNSEQVVARIASLHIEREEKPAEAEEGEEAAEGEGAPEEPGEARKPEKKGD